MIFWVIGRNDDWYSFDDSMVLTISSNIPSEIEMLYEIIPVKVIRRFYEHRNIIFFFFFFFFSYEIVYITPFKIFKIFLNALKISLRKKL